jgi:hypothetical protein
MNGDAERPKTSESDRDAETSPRENRELQEGLDYYLEDGLLVFTAAFLRKRGYCCESGCRHCPYQNNERGDREPE